MNARSADSVALIVLQLCDEALEGLPTMEANLKELDELKKAHDALVENEGAGTR
jgi:hypothetical protein